MMNTLTLLACLYLQIFRELQVTILSYDNRMDMAGHILADRLGLTVAETRRVRAHIDEVVRIELVLSRARGDSAHACRVADYAGYLIAQDEMRYCEAVLHRLLRG